MAETKLGRLVVRDILPGQSVDLVLYRDGEREPAGQVTVPRNLLVLYASWLLAAALRWEGLPE